MKKDIEWLRKEINELPLLFGGFSVLKQQEEFKVYKDDVLELIDQLDEPETNKIIELEQESIELENELQELDSYTRNLQTHCKEEIESLEHQLIVEKLFNEKEKQPKKNQFYWFKAKKIPLVVDVSYLSNENTLYGFKQAPNYHFIEHHDLRFITHATLDELIEQFR